MDAVSALILILGFGLLFFWCKVRVEENDRKKQERIFHCPHKPEWQQTIRVNEHRHGWIIPGHRWLTKHCRGCGRQLKLYSPSFQKWDEYVNEWNQETIDREAEYKAREKAHLQEQESIAKQRDKRTNASN